MRATLFCIFLLSSLATARAEVTHASPSGFSVTQRVVIDADVTPVWAAMTKDVSSWWNPALTASGSSGWMQFELVPGGCLCERFDDSNGVEHLRVTGVRAPRFLRLSGGLGPLGLMGVSGSMTLELTPRADGTSVELIYAVGGYHPDGLDTFAEPVDSVMQDLLKRLQDHVERPAND